jgi:ferredoxin
MLVDNGGSERLGMAVFWTSLKCIRCGACMNTCPVYRRSGGLSYAAAYSGPIGPIIDPTFNARIYSNLPFASTLNGSCSNVCPVKINIHERIYAWRPSDTNCRPIRCTRRRPGRDRSPCHSPSWWTPPPPTPRTCSPTQCGNRAHGKASAFWMSWRNSTISKMRPRTAFTSGVCSMASKSSRT